LFRSGSDPAYPILVKRPIFGHVAGYEWDACCRVFQAFDVGLGLVEGDVFEGDDADVEREA